jgi:spermidine/putrescine ABC transporter ATP-binding subunit
MAVWAAPGNGDLIVASVSLAGVSKTYDTAPVVDDIGFEVESGRFLTLLGPSGCGKSTTLRLIAGLVEPDRGEIMIDGRRVTIVPTHLRRIGMVFQNLALFPHMTVAQNVAFGLRMQQVPRDDRPARVREALAMVKLDGFDERLPRQLSGGQQQRVALARALVTRPMVLLLDEPFAALDRKLRLEMQAELRELTRRTGTTAVFVTHDQDEALVLSDRIAVMNRGRVEQIADPQTIFARPANAFVADFMGATNLLSGRVVVSAVGHCDVAIDGQPVTLSVPASLDVGRPVIVAVRPEAIALDRLQPGERAAAITGIIDSIVYQGSCSTYRLRVGNGELAIVARLQLIGRSESPQFKEGDQVGVSWDPAAAHVMLT